MLKGNKKSNFVPIDISGNIFQKTHFPPPPFLLYLSVNNVKCHLEYISPEVIIFNLFTKTKPEEKTLWYFFCSAHLGSNDSHNKPSRCFHPDPINWYWIIWATQFRLYSLNKNSSYNQIPISWFDKPFVIACKCKKIKTTNKQTVCCNHLFQ